MGLFHPIVPRRDVRGGWEGWAIAYPDLGRSEGKILPPHYYLPTQLYVAVSREINNGMAGNTAALSKFSDTLTLSQCILFTSIGFASSKIFHDYAHFDAKGQTH